MGRPRTPTEILDARGAYLVNPNRRPENEPTTDRPIGNPPSNLSKEEKKVWKLLVRECLPGVLKESDRTYFMLMVRLSTKLYTNQPMKSVEISQLISLGGRFAMTPADRSKVQVDKPKESSLSQFMQRRKTVQ